MADESSTEGMFNDGITFSIRDRLMTDIGEVAERLGLISGKKREVYIPNGINLNRRTAYYGGITVMGESWQKEDRSSLFGSATVSRVRLEGAAEAVDPLYRALEAEGFRLEGVYVRDVREKASLEHRTC